MLITVIYDYNRKKESEIDVEALQLLAGSAKRLTRLLAKPTIYPFHVIVQTRVSRLYQPETGLCHSESTL